MAIVLSGFGAACWVVTCMDAAFDRVEDRLDAVIECCAPVVISDGERIHELVELANRNKIPVRRAIESSGEAMVDLGNAWGLDNAFKMVTKHLAAELLAKLLGLAAWRSPQFSR